MRTTERDRKKLKCGFAATMVLALLLPLCARGREEVEEAILVAGPVKGKDQILPGEPVTVLVRAALCTL